MMRVCPVVLLILSFVASGIAAPSIDVAFSSPYRAAKTITVNLRGDSLQGATTLWTSFPAKAFRETALTSGNEREVSYTLFVPLDLPIGIGAIRVGTANGPSDVQLVMLDELPATMKGTATHSLSEAQEIKLPVAIDGYGKELGADYFKVNVQKGARLSVDIVAHRMGSLLDPVVRFLDENGRELVYCDDAPLAGADAQFSYQFAQAGTFYIEVRDTRYQGGPKFFYRMRAGDFALQPLAFLPVESSLARQPTNQLPKAKETEANDSIATAMTVEVPVNLGGGFSKLRDQDFYAFEVAKGERLIFEGKSRSKGFSCDLFMQVLKTNGTVIAEANVTGPNDAALTNRFDEAGRYVLLLEELTRQGGPDLRYELAIRPYLAGFDLTLETDAIEAPAGSTVDLKVNCARRDFDGPITLKASGLDEAFVLSNNTFAEKTNSITLKFTVPADLAAGRLLHFWLRGEAKVGDRTIEAMASTIPALRKQFPQMLYPPAELDGLIALGIKAAKKEEQPAAAAGN